MRISSSIRSTLFAVVVLALSASACAQIGISVSLAPPELPVYEQPACPGDGYIWTPGYWGYADAEAGYYWVPGAWIMAPEPNFLWTPGYWGWGGHGYAFNEGYWGLHVGFYGGVSYGYGYFGEGFEGGRWQEGHFYYNRSVSNVNVTNIHNVYNTTVIHNSVNRVSYNGGSGGVDRRPSAQEESFSRERHVAPVAAQTQHAQSARSNPEQRASAIHGGAAGSARPEGSNSPRNEPAKEAGAANREETARPENVVRPETGARPTIHPKDLPARAPYTANTGNAARNQRLQSGHDQLIAKQDQERQKLQQQQDQEHQRQATQNTNEAGMQKLEQQHTQQTQKLQQKHTQQEQKLQGRNQAPAPKHAATLK
jgi:hypothetical protein